MVHTISRRIRIHQTAIHMDFAAVYQSGFNARLDDPHEQFFKNRPAPSPSRFAQYTVVWYFIVQVHLQKPQVIEPLADNPYQFSFATNVVPKKQQHQFHNHDWIFRFVSILSVNPADLLSHEPEIHQIVDLPQRIIPTNSLLQVNPVMKQLCLSFLRWAHHMLPTYDLDGTAKGRWATAPSGRGYDLPPLRGSNRIASQDNLRAKPRGSRKLRQESRKLPQKSRRLRR